MADASRDRMCAQIASGANPSTGARSAAGKMVLGRGCDPSMAARAPAILGPHLGGAEMVVTTSDSEFFSLLQSKKFNVVFFAPGACRHDAAGNPIPGGIAESQGWSLEQYRQKVKQQQGEEIAIVETTEEREMIPLLQNALGLA
eukprot:TRINITY_DN46909_c0_g1_i1.p2 TRINITY_DN46909_c0_g1~~TRINITY_DN46909_c0_g1_i1.p2  ORF type:complete len:144 (-),score=27.25 TRINITY_DN46909_c0_g1_i1:134-565(-)